jgi:ribose transport system substrate-binding protein
MQVPLFFLRTYRREKTQVAVDCSPASEHHVTRRIETLLVFIRRDDVREIKKIVLAVLALAVCFLTGCSRHDNDERYILVTVNTKLEYWQSAQAGLTKAANQYGVKFDVRGPDNYDPADEEKEFRGTFGLKPAGLLVSVADAKIMQPAIDDAIAAGIPVVTIDSDAPASKRLFFIGTNNVAAGTQGGKRLVEKLHGKGNVVFFTMPQPNLDERLKGYKDVLANSPGIKIIEVVDIKGDAGNAFDRAQHYVGAKNAEKVDAFVCLEASSAKSVAEALKRENAKDRLVIAMDTDQDTLNLIKSGDIDSTISQKPFTMAFYGLQSLDLIHHNKTDLTKDHSADSFSPFPAFVDTGSTLVDKTNVDFYLQAREASHTK